MSRFSVFLFFTRCPHFTTHNSLYKRRRKISMEQANEYIFEMPEDTGRNHHDFGHESQDLSFCDPMPSFLSTPSCPSTAASSRRSSEVSFADTSSTFSCFSPTSPTSKFAHYDEFAAQSVRSTGTFSSRLPFFGKQAMELDLCEGAFAENLGRQDPYFMQPPTYANDNFNADLPHEFSIDSINFSGLDRMANPKAPAAVGWYETGVIMPSPDETTDMTFVSPIALRPSPPFVLPSQTLRYVDSDTTTILSPEGSPELLAIDSLYRSDGTLMGASYGSSERPNSSETVSTKRVKSLHRTHPGSRKRQASVKFLDQRIVNSRFAVRECTRATSTKSKKFKCLTCNSGFDRQEHYKRHLVSKTHRDLLATSEMKSPEPEPKSYLCQMCDKPFNRHDNRQAHIKTHLPTEGKHHRRELATVEQSISFGWEELDPRINPALKLKVKKKGRSRVRE